MDIRDLHYFQIVAECEHMGRAAERLRLTQPALTKAVHRLEDVIGAALFIRVGRRIALTELGRLLLERTYRLRQIMDDTTREIKSYADGLSGHIRFGCAPTMAKFLLPDVMNQLLREAPGVTMELHASMSGELLMKLREGLLDLVLTPTTGPIEKHEVIPLVNDDIVVVAGRTHPIFDAPYTIRDLARFNWVLPHASATRPWLESVLNRHGCPPPYAQVEATSILYLPRLMARTELLSVLSRRNLSDLDDGETLREVELPEAPLRRVFCIVFPTHTHLSPVVRKLIDLLRKKADADLSFYGNGEG